MGGYGRLKKGKTDAAWWAVGKSKERKGSYGYGKHETEEGGHRLDREARLGIRDDALVLRQDEDDMQEGSRNDGVRHSGWRAGGDSYRCHYRVPAEDSGTVGCDCDGNQQFVGGAVGTCALGSRGVRLRSPCLARRLTSESGQGTLEYALVMFGFLSIVAGLGALWNMLDGGLLVSHALASASHHVQAVTPGAVADVFAF